MGFIAPQWLFQVLDNAGNVAIGAKLYSYVAGTSIPTPLYSDYACTSPVANPFVMNSAGRGEFWLDESVAYRLRVEDAQGNVLEDRSPILVGAGALGGDAFKVNTDETDQVPGYLNEKIEDTEDIVWAVSETGPDEDHRFRATLAKPYPVTEIQAFPAKEINWLSDSGGDLWDDETQLAFRMDFLTNGHRELVWFKSLFYSNAGVPRGRFAIYGELATKLYDDALPDGDLYGVRVFDEPIDISNYRFLVVVMDPGVSAAPQPVAQSITTMPVSPGLGRYSFAHMVEHVHNTAFPDEAPPLPSLDMKYMLARWCALGVR